MKSMTVLGAIMALAVTLSTFCAQAATPSEMASLKPFKQFAKGEGEGVAHRYIHRNKEQIIALLRDKELAKKELRVTCEVLVRQMMEAHVGLPFEGCEGTAATIEKDENFKVVACQDSMFERDNWLTVTNSNGTSHGAWNRKCLAGEQVLVYKDKPLLSTTCMNVAIPKTARVAQVRPQPETGWRARTVIEPLKGGTCPPILTLRVVQNSVAKLPGVAAELGDDAGRKQRPVGTKDDGSEATDVSRGHGASIQASGTPRSTKALEVVVTHVRGEMERVLYEGPIVGERVIPRPSIQGEERIIVRSTSNTALLSPARSGNIIWPRELQDCGRNIVTMIERTSP